MPSSTNHSSTSTVAGVGPLRKILATQYLFDTSELDSLLVDHEIVIMGDVVLAAAYPSPSLAADSTLIFWMHYDQIEESDHTVKVDAVETFLRRNKWKPHDVPRAPVPWAFRTWTKKGVSNTIRLFIQSPRLAQLRLMYDGKTISQEPGLVWRTRKITWNWLWFQGTVPSTLLWSITPLLTLVKHGWRIDDLNKDIQWYLYAVQGRERSSVSGRTSGMDRTFVVDRLTTVATTFLRFGDQLWNASRPINIVFNTNIGDLTLSDALTVEEVNKFLSATRIAYCRVFVSAKGDPTRFDVGADYGISRYSKPILPKKSSPKKDHSRFNTMTVKQLHVECKAAGIRGYSKMKKAELQMALGV